MAWVRHFVCETWSYLWKSTRCNILVCTVFQTPIEMSNNVGDHPFRTSAFLGGGAVKNWPNLPTDRSKTQPKGKGGRGKKSWNFADVLNGWFLAWLTDVMSHFWCSFMAINTSISSSWAMLDNFHLGPVRKCMWVCALNIHKKGF